MAVLRALRNRVLAPLLGTPREGGTLGVYGAPNAGKTLLANRICRDARAADLGVASATPHETRKVTERRRLTLRVGDRTLRLDLRDTPGLASSVDAGMFAQYGIATVAEARYRAHAATEGILASIESLRGVDGILLVVDSRQDPCDPANGRIVQHARARRVPLLVAANKIDLPRARPMNVASAFPNATVVPVSALTGSGIEALYLEMLDRFAA